LSIFFMVFLDSPYRETPKNVIKNFEKNRFFTTTTTTTTTTAAAAAAATERAYSLATSGGSSWSALVLAALVLAFSPLPEMSGGSAPIGGNLIPYGHGRQTHSGFAHGVYANNKKRWAKAQIRCDGKQHRLDRFDTPKEETALAYDRAARGREQRGQ
jgi:hypothetical protein